MSDVAAKNGGHLIGEQPIPCTAQVLVRNSAGSIRTCLDTLGAFAEVIVQDGNSTDGTREIAGEYSNVRILDQNPAFLDGDGRINDFASIRNESIVAAKYDWIFVVDGDEHVDPGLVEEIGMIVLQNKPGVYQAFRRFYIDGEPVVYSAFYPAYQIRLFHRSLVEGYRKSVHERLVLRQGVEMKILQHELPVPLPPVKSLRSKYNRYLAMEIRKTGVISWRQWFRWGVYHNIRSITGLFLYTFWQRILPKRGKRMPFSHVFAHVRQLFTISVLICPPMAKRWLARNGSAHS